MTTDYTDVTDGFGCSLVIREISEICGFLRIPVRKLSLWNNARRNKRNNDGSDSLDFAACLMRGCVANRSHARALSGGAL
jgi:hypothetical protein